MSNQPKITYRSDMTGCIYQMMQQGNAFTIQAVTMDIVVSESPYYGYLYPWRKNIDMFFDLVTIHINEKKWKEDSCDSPVLVKDRRRNFLDGR